MWLPLTFTVFVSGSGQKLVICSRNLSADTVDVNKKVESRLLYHKNLLGLICLLCNGGEKIPFNSSDRIHNLLFSMI